MKGTGLRHQEESTKTEVVEGYTGDQAANFRFYMDRLNKARDQRYQIREEFDGLNFEDYISANRQAKNSYLYPKLNDNEIRISTGEVEKKMDTVVVELVAMNLQPDVKVFDEDDLEIQELGKDFGDIVKRTNEIEKDDDLYQEAVTSILYTPITIIEELYVNKKIKTPNGYKIDQRAEKRLAHPSQWFFADINLPYYRLKDQPYIIKYERMTYKEAETIYGDLPNWKGIRPNFPGGNQYNISSYTYRFGVVGEDEVEILHYFSYQDDEYMCIINGVMMYDEPLSYSEEFGNYNGYHIAISGLKTFNNDFLYFRPLTASARLLAGLSQEVMRLLIRKWRQTLAPAIGVTVGKIFSRDIWEPGSMVQGIKKDDTFLLNPNQQGINSGDVQVMELIDNKIEQFMAVPGLMQGVAGKKMTATQAQSQMTQAMKQLGLAVAAVIRLKRDLTYLRIYTELQHDTNPVGKIKDTSGKLVNIYKKFTVDDAILENDLTGKKIIQFTDRSLTPDEKEEVYRSEEQLSKNNKPVRFKFINAKMLRDIPTIWYVTVAAEEKSSSALSKIMFKDQVAQAQEISALSGRPLNGDGIIEKFGLTWKVKPEKWFGAKQEPIPGQDGIPGEVIDQPGSPADKLRGGVVRSKEQKPSLKALGQEVTKI